MDVFDGWMQSRVDIADTGEDMKTFIIKDDGTIYNQKSDYACGDIDLYASLMTDYNIAELIEIILSNLNDSIEAEE